MDTSAGNSTVDIFDGPVGSYAAHNLGACGICWPVPVAPHKARRCRRGSDHRRDQFRTTQGTSTVTFNGAPAGTATTWSDTSITVNVPNGATTGNAVVRLRTWRATPCPLQCSPW
jgi:hypothetical protein